MLGRCSLISSASLSVVSVCISATKNKQRYCGSCDIRAKRTSAPRKFPRCNFPVARIPDRTVFTSAITKLLFCVYISDCKSSDRVVNLQENYHKNRFLYYTTA